MTGTPSHAYASDAAAAWMRGPAALYDTVALRTLEGFTEELRGAAVVDVGAGTGAFCRALRRVRAMTTAVDTSPDMLSLLGDAADNAVCADMRALPFPDKRFDAAVSGFAISHIEEPEQALAEMNRVVRPGGLVIATVFGEAPDGASKEAVTDVAIAFGYSPPEWYTALKTRTEPRSNTPPLLRACAESAGLTHIDVRDTIIDSGLSTPESIASYRLGLAHMAPFVAALPPARRMELTRRAVAAVRDCGQPVRPRVLILSSRTSE